MEPLNQWPAPPAAPATAVVFNPLAKGFSLANALFLAEKAAAAYSAVPTIRCESTDTSVIIEEAEDYVLVSFPGTRDFADVLKDLEAWRLARSFGGQTVGVHKGFCIAIESVIDEVAKALAMSRLQKIKPIFICGHSKGGALARLCAAYLAQRHIETRGIYTYGEPRSGCGLMAWFCQNEFGDRHFRIEHGADCITRLPGWFMGNRHSGHNVLTEEWGWWLDPVLLVKIFQDWLEYRRAKSLGPAALLALGRDHHVSNYVNCLQALLRIACCVGEGRGWP